MSLESEMLAAEWGIAHLNTLLNTGTWVVVMVPAHGETEREREKLVGACTGIVNALVLAQRMSADLPGIAAQRRGRWAYVIRRA